MAAYGGLITHLGRWAVTQTRHKYGIHHLISRDISGTSTTGLFDKILVANRGEIACRVMRTAHLLGIPTVAVYSEADKYAKHVDMSDEAYCIGPPPSSDSYLRMDKIIDVAKKTRSQAIHPGYGFLSENRHFADLCEKEGIEFIGPPASAIEKMGVKGVSKAIMSQSSVPIVPGYFGDDQSDSTLKAEADKIGYPVLIKADLGGGGKGMRIVPDEAEFITLLESCRSEAMKSFNDDKVLLEKYVEKPRHVEVQIFGDKYGKIVHLYERDCSVQRRHQKIIEEAPAPGLKRETKEAIWAAAVRAAKAVGYVGAGTVEFIMDIDENFYFMEMNTRLQVEHPITEMITGTDLVEWQIRVASGEPLPLEQSDIPCIGHAFEARIYAENPAESFMPSPGYLHYLATPTLSSTVRIDTGVRQGDEVTAYYDPMIAKLVVSSNTREMALRKLIKELQRYQIIGVHSNLPFLTSLAEHPAFQSGDVHTGFIEQHKEALFPNIKGLSPYQQQLAVLVFLLLEKQRDSSFYEHDPYSLFNTNTGIRVNTLHSRQVSLQANGEVFTADVQYHDNDRYSISTSDDNEWISAEGTVTEKDSRLIFNGFLGEKRVMADIVFQDTTIHCFTNDGHHFSVQFVQPEFYTQQSLQDVGGARSPDYSTRVNKVLVVAGDIVKKGQVLMTVEGMKMETNILAPSDGKVEQVFYKEGDTVPADSKVIELEDITE